MPPSAGSDLGMLAASRIIEAVALSVARHGCLDAIAKDQAQEALIRLGKVVGLDVEAREPVGMPVRSVGPRLQLTARKIDTLVRWYADQAQPTLTGRARLRGTSLTSLLTEAWGCIQTCGAGGMPDETPGSLGVKSSTVAGDWSPAASAAAESFARIAQATHCFFAQKSVVWTAPEPDANSSISAYGEFLSRYLRGFVAACRREPLDALAVPLPAEAGAELPALCKSLRELLAGIRRADARASKFSRSSFDDPRWFMSCYGERMFVVTMAPCYGADQSRYVFGEPYTFVVFQPDSAFDRVVKPGNHGLISASTRREIRARYGGNGRAYDSAISSSPFEAYRFIKPLAVGDAPVRWWDTQAESGPADDYA